MVIYNIRKLLLVISYIVKDIGGGLIMAQIWVIFLVYIRGADSMKS